MKGIAAACFRPAKAFAADFKKATRSDPRYRIGMDGAKPAARLVQAPAEVKNPIRQHTEPKK